MGSLDRLAIDGPSLRILVIDGPSLETPLLSSKLFEDDADDKDEEESSDSEEEEEEHLAPTVLAPALHSFILAFEPFEEGETVATPPPFGYRVAARISRARFTTPTGGYEVGESSVAAARQIRPDLTVADSRRAEDRLIGRLRGERRYFRTL
nr:hypothetical protein [Tanacetum cinerariifolium]